MSHHKNSSKTIWIWGTGTVSEFLKTHPDAVKQICVLSDAKDRLLRTVFNNTACRFDELPDLVRLGIPKDAVHQGICAKIAPIWHFDEANLKNLKISKEFLAVVCDQITDPQNLGAIIRSAAAFQASLILCPKDNTAPITGVTAKASAGGLAHVRICEVVNLARTISMLKEKGVWFAALSVHADMNIWELDANLPLAIALGSEGKGLRQNVEAKCDFHVKIPHSPVIDSLNVGSSASIALYEITKKRIST